MPGPHLQTFSLLCCFVHGRGEGSQVPERPWTWLISQRGQDSTGPFHRNINKLTQAMPGPTCLQGSLKEISDPLIKPEDRKLEVSFNPLRKRKFLSRTFYEP